MIAALVPGMLTYRLPEGESHNAAVSAGMIKVEANDVLVLVDAAERPDGTSTRSARAARLTRPAKSSCKSAASRNTAPPEGTLARALNRLRVKDHQG